MDLLTKDDLKILLLQAQPPCVSFFLPTHRGGDEADPIRWKNLLGRAEEGLIARGLRPARARELLGPAGYLLDDAPFWKGQSDGLAFFLSPTIARSFRLPAPFEEQVVVADRFHVTPLLPLLRGDGRFYVLALSQNRVRLLQGTAWGAHEVNVRGMPTGLAQALRFHDRDEPLIFHTHPALKLGRWGAVFSGHGVGIDDHKDDLLLYFRQIDGGLHQLLHGEQAPLVLASVDYLWPIYHEANTYAHLLDHGVAGNPDRLSDKELHEKAWAAVRTCFDQRQRRAAMYAQLAGTGRTSDDLAEVVRAAYGGQVEILFVRAGAQRWGTFAWASGAVDVHEEPMPGDEDLLNFAAIHVLLHAGAVHVVRSDEVPGRGPVAAVYWLPRARKSQALRARS
jgi:hypothetical protein